jgi:hypothetical protein
VASCGPGDDSGWYCTEKSGSWVWVSPSTVWSLRLTWVSWALPPSDSTSTAKPWFWLVISTLPVVRSMTGWLPPWWPNLSL